MIGVFPQTVAAIEIVPVRLKRTKGHAVYLAGFVVVSRNVVVIGKSKRHQIAFIGKLIFIRPAVGIVIEPHPEITGRYVLNQPIRAPCSGFLRLVSRRTNIRVVGFPEFRQRLIIGILSGLQVIAIDDADAHLLRIDLGKERRTIHFIAREISGCFCCIIPLNIDLNVGIGGHLDVGSSRRCRHLKVVLIDPLSRRARFANSLQAEPRILHQNHGHGLADFQRKRANTY